MSEIEWKPFEDRCYENAVKAHVGRVRVVVEENTDRDPHERFYVHAEVDGLQDHECNAGTLGQYRTTLDEAKAAGLELAAKLEAWMSGVSRELSFDRLRDRNTARCESAYHPISAWSPTDWACAMAGECGEACNLVKKLKRLERPSTHSLQPERDILIGQVSDELADLVIYADLLAARLEINLGAAVRSKFNVTSAKVGSEVRL